MRIWKKKTPPKVYRLTPKPDITTADLAELLASTGHMVEITVAPEMQGDFERFARHFTPATEDK